MFYIYDASFIIAIILPDEKNPKIDSIHDALDENDAISVPQLMWYEVANIFRKLIQRKRFSLDEVKHFFPMVSFISLITDFTTGINYSKKIWDIANNYNLSAYDAAYLELAERKNAVLCTLDERLNKAAREYGVTIIN